MFSALQVVDTKGGSSLKSALKTTTKRRRKSRPSHHSRAEKHLKTLSKHHTDRPIGSLRFEGWTRRHGNRFGGSAQGGTLTDTMENIN